MYNDEIMGAQHFRTSEDHTHLASIATSDTWSLTSHYLGS